MNAIVVIAIIVAVAVLSVAALGVLGGVLANIADKAKSNWLGRKRLGKRAFIPKELEESSKPLPASDPERKALQIYDPKPVTTIPPETTKFRGHFDALFAPWSDPDRRIDIDQAHAILLMPRVIPYESYFSIVGDEVTYPHTPPVKPPDIPPPPSWSPWHPNFGEPSFAPPYYAEHLAFLNKIVDETHRREAQRVNAALDRREELTRTVEKRNRDAEDLAKLARAKYEEAVTPQNNSFDRAMSQYQKDKEKYETDALIECRKFQDCRDVSQRPGEAGLMVRIDLALRTMKWPSFASREGQSRFDADSGILIHEHRFPDLSEVEWIKQVELKSGWTIKPANQREKKDAAAKIHPSLCLRLAAELARLDVDNIIKAIAINGWADYSEKSTGQRKRAYCAALFATKEQLSNLSLSTLDPIEAFAVLKGVSARTLDITPIAPIIRLDTNDDRFIDAKEVLAKMAEGDNLASMDWEDFEHLIRELFERAFAVSGAAVKVTQASRDQGVDAVIFDPDPLRGGKIIIQAKRYTNVVDVSAVRDLFGAVMNEGANKGILVTTSHYGSESYSFAKDKPLTLLDGRELLSLLEKHGYNKFRINLAEAKSALAALNAPGGLASGRR